MNVDNIAHNLANANTTGYKARRAQFQYLLYQTVVQPGSASGQQTTVPPVCKWAWVRALRPTRFSFTQALSRRPTILWTW